MSKKKIAIRFKNIHQLWAYAQQIRATSIEIITSDMILICNCTEKDIEVASQYNGEIIQGFRHYNPQPFNQNRNSFTQNNFE